MLTPQHDRFCRELHRLICETGGKIGRARKAAYVSVYGDGKSATDNARKLANKPHIKARLAELAAGASLLVKIDSGWAMLQLARRVEDFNLDDYLTPAGRGERYFDISNCSRELLGRLGEMTIEEEIVEAGEETMRKVRKIKLKPYDPAPIIGLMARIGGWEAPKKIAPTNPEGDGPAHMIVSWLEPEEAQAS
jgi:hypothetical protein